jgi:DNA-binding GntR family transcriptional regulator
MSALHSKTAFLYSQVRRGLQSGIYIPGQRIDPVELAAQFNISMTPARLAMQRLAAEGLISDHARNGMQVPLPNELTLRERYDLMQRLLQIACDLIKARRPDSSRLPIVATAKNDPVKLTWKLFDAIAAQAGHGELHQLVKRTNDRLASIRRAKQGMIHDIHEELSELLRHWHHGDLDRLESALAAYHERRIQLVPHIVFALTVRAERLQ